MKYFPAHKCGHLGEPIDTGDHSPEKWEKQLHLLEGQPCSKCAPTTAEAIKDLKVTLKAED